ncbi:MAG: hypothetical protein H0W61_08770 [Bacteroidetes bacterium]|nr:hypothetical protein [Bacteroidota bacterium]
MKRFLLLILFFPLMLAGQHKRRPKPVYTLQQRHKIDSLKIQLKKDSLDIYGFKRIRPYINYHERNSIENNKIINFYGPQVGTWLFERHIVGIGAYFSTHNTRKPFQVIDDNLDATKKIDIKYMTVFYQYVLIQKRFFELHLPFEIGRGILKSEYRNTDNEVYKHTSNPFTIGAAGTQFIFKPLRWVGLSAILGYRKAEEKIIDGFFYAVGIWIGFKPLLMDVSYYHKRKEFRKQRKLILKP